MSRARVGGCVLTHTARWWGVIALVIACVVILAITSCAARAAEVVNIPQTSYLYRFKLEREVTARFGTDAHVARIAGQVHAESNWRADARSAYAEGMSQFTPATAAWIQSICPEIGAADPWDPNWSMRAVVCYDDYLFEHVSGASLCDRWAFTFSAYNGGLSWIARDKARASANGADPAMWFDHVERFSARAGWARVENRAYVARILRTLEPAYIAAGWPGKLACP